MNRSVGRRPGSLKFLAGLLALACLVVLLAYAAVQIKDGLVDLWWLDALG